MGMRNSLEASMAKAKAGLVGHPGYAEGGRVARDRSATRARYLLEKWMRDAKINDIFEGTQQINMIIVARRILEYSSKELN